MAKNKNVVELSKIEKFYIENNFKKFSIDELSEDLGRSPEHIEKFFNECVDNSQKSDTIDKLMIVNSKRGYAVMSKEASERGEATKTKSTVPADHIHKIR